MTQSQPTAALDHLRVLDLTNGLGQMCPRALGDLGADVIKVEPPEGDPTRRMAPFAGDEPGPERSLRFIHANRSKRSVVIDMDAPEGRDLVRSLAERSDILVEDRTPGYLAGLGLGFEKLRELNPALVYVSITPFGQTGPHAGYRGGDLITQSASGMMIANGDDGSATLHGALRDHGPGRLRTGGLRRSAGHPRPQDHRPGPARRSLPPGGHHIVGAPLHLPLLPRERHHPQGGQALPLRSGEHLPLRRWSLRQHFRVQRRPLRPAGQGHYGASHTLGGCLDEPDGPPRKPGAHRHSA